MCGSLATATRPTAPIPSRSSSRTVAPLLAAAVVAACARVPRGRTVVDDIDIEGAEAVSADDILEKIAIEPTPTFLGVRLPWTTRSLLDEHVLERDVRRITRFYRARGYYDARVLSTEIVPDGDEVDIRIAVDEGQAVVVRQLRVRGLDGLATRLRRRAMDRVQLEEGRAFDEALYDRTKARILKALRNEGYARATVRGHVVVARDSHEADVVIRVRPGPVCRFRNIRVLGLEAISESRIRVTLGIRRGDKFSDEALESAQSALFGLGVFQSVSVRPAVDQDEPWVDLDVELSEADFGRFRLGGGIGADRKRTGFHLTQAWEHRNLLGGLQRLTIAERPGFSVSPTLFSPDTFGFDNRVNVDFSWPGLPEAQTTLLHRGAYDAGLDTSAGLCRHDVRLSTGLTRPLTKWLRGTVSHELQYYVPVGGRVIFQCPDLANVPSTYDKTFLSYVREAAVIDMRDDPFNTRRGGYVSVTVSESPRWLGTKLGFVSIVGDVRGYLTPLPGVGLAGRMLVGRALPFPQEKTLPAPLRFFGGGGSSVRGYDTRTIGHYYAPCAPDEHGAVPRGCSGADSATATLSEGGDVQWELSAEIRLRLIGPLGLVGFLDLGDVYLPNAGERLDLGRHHASLGVGLRIKTVVGPIRFDVAGRLPSKNRPEENPGQQDFFGLFQAPVTLHFALGEAY